jgi:hypothetical protein
MAPPPLPTALAIGGRPGSLADHLHFPIVLFERNDLLRLRPKELVEEVLRFLDTLIKLIRGVGDGFVSLLAPGIPMRCRQQVRRFGRGV